MTDKPLQPLVLKEQSSALEESLSQVLPDIVTPSSKEPVNILVVDDDPRNIFTIEEALNPFPGNIITATSGRQALREILKQKFALILLDVKMPDIDGFEVAKTISQKQETREIPIIFITAVDKTDLHRVKGYDIGAVDYLFKPIDPRILQAKVKVFVELYRSRLQIEEQNCELRRSNSDLEEFAYVISHDLKAPLRGISSVARWLLEDLGTTISPDSKENLELMLERTLRMDQLIDGVLSYSRAARLPTAPKIVNLQAMVEQLISELPPSDSIVIRIEGTLPRLTIDETQIYQVFQNLIMNAIQHFGKPAGEIVISCQEQDQNWVLTVRDTGMGISKRQQDKIFSLFHTLKSKDNGGRTGVGLAIVKKIIERLNGTITVRSKEDKGSTFIITFPKTSVSVNPEDLAL